MATGVKKYTLGQLNLELPEYIELIKDPDQLFDYIPADDDESDDDDDDDDDDSDDDSDDDDDDQGPVEVRAADYAKAKVTIPSIDSNEFHEFEIHDIKLNTKLDEYWNGLYIRIKTQETIEDKKDGDAGSRIRGIFDPVLKSQKAPVPGYLVVFEKLKSKSGLSQVPSMRFVKTHILRIKGSRAWSSIDTNRSSRSSKTGGLLPPLGEYAGTFKDLHFSLKGFVTYMETEVKAPSTGHYVHNVVLHFIRYVDKYPLLPFTIDATTRAFSKSKEAEAILTGLD